MSGLFNLACAFEELEGHVNGAERHDSSSRDGHCSSVRYTFAVNGCSVGRTGVGDGHLSVASDEKCRMYLRHARVVDLKVIRGPSADRHTPGGRKQNLARDRLLALDGCDES